MAADPLITRPRSASEPLAAAPTTRDTWQELENLVDELAALAKTDLAAHDFYARLLDRSMRALAAVGGAVWLRDTEGWRLEYQINLAQARAGEGKASPEAQALRIESLASLGEVRMLAPNSGTS